MDRNDLFSGSFPSDRDKMDFNGPTDTEASKTISDQKKTYGPMTEIQDGVRTNNHDKPTW